VKLEREHQAVKAEIEKAAKYARSLEQENLRMHGLLAKHTESNDLKSAAGKMS